MKFNKKDIEQALKTITVPGEGQNMIDSQAVKNIIVFSDEVIVDITISNPSLQAKKRTEVDILKTIHELVYAKAKITVNIKVEAATQPKNEIKGKSIPGIQNIVAIASGKGGVHCRLARLAACPGDRTSVNQELLKVPLKIKY